MGTDGIVWKSLEIFATSGNSPARSESVWNINPQGIDVVIAFIKLTASTANDFSGYPIS